MASYDGFISYSHTGDGALAPELEAALERVARPWWRRPTVDLFRDETGLAVDPSLWGAIERTLEGCRHLVLLAGPEAAASVWVDREVAWWLDHRDPSSILVVLTAGTWGADGDSVPPALGGRLTEVPEPLDLRWARADPHHDLRDERWLAAVATLAARLRGVPVEQVRRQHRRARSATRRLVVGLGVLLGVAAVAALVAARDARDEQRRAEARRDAVVAQRLVRQAGELAPVRPDVAALLAVEAHRRAPGPAATVAMTSVLGADDVVTAMRIGDGRSPRSLAIAPDGDAVLIGRVDGSVLAWWPGAPVGSGAPREREVGTPHRAAVVTLGPGPEGLVSVGADGSVCRWDDLEPRACAPGGGGVVTEAVVDEVGGDVVMGLIDGSVLRLGATGGRERLLGPAERRQRVTGLAFAPDGDEVVAAWADGTMAVVDPADGTTRVRTSLSTSGNPVSGVAWSADGSVVAAMTIDARVRFLDPDLVPTGTADAGVQAAPGRQVLALDGNTFLSIGGDRRVVTWDADEGPVGAFEAVHAGLPVVAAASLDGPFLVSAGADGSLNLVAPRASGLPAAVGTEVVADGQLDVLAAGGSVDARRIPLGVDTGTGVEVVVLDATDGRTSTVDGAWDPDDPLWSIASGPPGSGTAVGRDTGTVLWVPEDGEPTLLEVAGTPVVSVAVTGAGSVAAVDSSGAAVAFDPDASAPVAAELGSGRAVAVVGRPGVDEVYVMRRSTVERWSVDGPRLLARVGVDGLPSGLSVLDDATVAVHEAGGRTTLLGADDLVPSGAVLAGSGIDVVGAATLVGAVVTADSAGDVALWDPATGSRLGSLPTPGQGEARSLVPAGDGVALVVADGRVSAYEPDADSLARELCRRVGGDLSAQDAARYLPGEPVRSTCAGLRRGS